MSKHLMIGLISAAIAGVLMASLMYMAQQPSNGPNIVTLCILPFWMIGAHFSGNIHQSGIAMDISMFLFFFLPIFVALSIWSWICKSSKE